MWQNYQGSLALLKSDRHQRFASRFHCQLIQDDGRWMIEDLNSTNGTYLNGERLNPNQPIAVTPGDSICIGNAVIEMVE